ncbi:beta-ketoacyl synthase N-terminal-like domain-containing protein [Actinocatenispora comari]|uniref:Beta-ketoacyl synthase-like N-terminal domain-containing protein n=1 Tax=Actinocatenispora comari TaxID=2807577 RepID=A0A8J4ALZ4_9ACTN|nr:beta-ketoacyl synthase N-terminal-like domain-containing protein [Actinocatenispora comari]GIL31892.1 hypothetical protein NUM_71460 [Actinocatenispora comari]
MSAAPQTRPGMAITGVGLAVPGVDDPADLRTGGWQPTAPAVDPAARLGRRGLRYKDRATQLALCAARDALADALVLTEDGPTVDPESVAVVVSSNLGNLDTVCRVADTIGAEGVSGTSPMDLPNASSNVIASSVAIRFGLRGPNLTVCNGAPSGLDAVRWATRLIAAGRAELAVVVGVETDNEVVRRLLGPGPHFDGAAAVVVEAAGPAAARGIAARAELGRYVRAADLAGCLRELGPEPPETSWCLPDGLADEPLTGAVTRIPDSAAATGVLQCVVAAVRADAGTVRAVAGSRHGAGTAVLELRPAGAVPARTAPAGHTVAAAG